MLPQPERDRVAAVHALADHVEQRSLVLPALDRGTGPLVLVGAATRLAPAAAASPRSARSSGSVTASFDHVCGRGDNGAGHEVACEELSPPRGQHGSIRSDRNAQVHGRSCRQFEDVTRSRRRPRLRYRDHMRPAPRAVAIACIVGLAILASAVAANAGDTPTAQGNVKHLHFELGPLDIRPGQNVIETNKYAIPQPKIDGWIVGFRPNLRLADGIGAARRRDPPAPRRLVDRHASRRHRTRFPSGSSASARRRPRSTCRRATATATRRATTGGSTT